MILNLLQNSMLNMPFINLIYYFITYSNFNFLTSDINHTENIISIITIKTETITGSNIMPTIRTAKDIIMDITEYAFDLYNHPKGNKCAPKIIAKTITILSGTARYIIS